MTARDTRLDRARDAMTEREPYFAETFVAARNLLRSATWNADSLRWTSGAVCKDGHCDCMGLTECLHEIAWRMHAEEHTL